jgi:hypothetical protein
MHTQDFRRRSMKKTRQRGFWTPFWYLCTQMHLNTCMPCMHTPIHKCKHSSSHISYNHKSCSWTARIHSFANSPFIHAHPPFWHTPFAKRRKTKASATQDDFPHPFWVCKPFPSLSRGKIGDLQIPQRICRSQWGPKFEQFWACFVEKNVR